jgi:hypothetical protein
LDAGWRTFPLLMRTHDHGHDHDHDHDHVLLSNAEP